MPAENSRRANRLTKTILPLRTGMQFLARKRRCVSSTQVVPSPNDSPEKNYGERVALERSGFLILGHFSAMRARLEPCAAPEAESTVTENRNHSLGKLPGRILQQLREPFRIVKLTAILARRRSDRSQERTPHRVRTAKSTGGSNLFEALVRCLQLPAHSLGSRLQNIVRWRLPQLAREHALEISNAHCGAVCELLYGQIVMKVFRNPNLKLMKCLHFRCLCR